MISQFYGFFFEDGRVGVIFLGHPMNTMKGQGEWWKQRRGRDDRETIVWGNGRAGPQINGYHFGSVIRKKLSFHWCQPIPIHKDLGDLKNFQSNHNPRNVFALVFA